ncbi:hypothetical protein L6164_026105 [Bauhinia variegata]|uniref:Uncharacterized protein n=1 Tax=Bauhinia variegata TaxID=167791 RepID=A0ACB9M322_BAUVA|nr:hypothetical protein L6164_026105 [Bauhinia variegata]
MLSRVIVLGILDVGKERLRGENRNFRSVKKSQKIHSWCGKGTNENQIERDLEWWFCVLGLEVWCCTFVEDLNWIDSIYLLVMFVTTVGYGWWL